LTTIIIRESKTSNDPALVPIPTTLLKMINQWISENKLSPKKYLFSSNRSKTISRSQISRIIVSNAKQAGIEKIISTHTFRRTRATHLLDAGLPLEQVSRLLRHKHLSSTMTYLRISIKGLQKAVSKIDEAEQDY